MTTRGTILLAIGMLILGLLIGVLTGGVAGFFMGQNTRPTVSQNISPQLPMQQQPVQPGPSSPRSLPPAANVIGGARVEDVEKDSPADKAGLKVGDVITAVGSTKLDATNSLTDVIKTYKPGDTVELSVTRGSQTLKLGVELGASADNSNTARLGIRYTPMIPGGRFRFPNG